MQDSIHLPKSIAIKNEGRSWYVGNDPAFAHSIDALLHAVERDVKPGGRVIVGNTDMRRVPYNDTFLYYLLPRYVPGTASMEFEPGLTNRRGTTLTGEMQRADAFIASDRWLNWNEPNDAMKPGDPGPADVLHRRFCLKRRLRERLQAVPALSLGQRPAAGQWLARSMHLEARVAAERPVRAQHRERLRRRPRTRGPSFERSMTTNRTPNSRRSASTSAASNGAPVAAGRGRDAAVRACDRTAAW